MNFLRRFLVFLLVLPPFVTSEAGVLRFGIPELNGIRSKGAPTTSPTPTVQAGEDELIVEWWAPQAETRVLPDGRTSLVMPGFARVDKPGAPRLPYATVLVSLPPGAAPTLELRQVSENEISLPGPVELAGRPQGVLYSPDGQVIGGAFGPALEAVPFDPQVIVLEPLGILRGAQLARLVFYPARPDGGMLRVTTHVQAVLHYNLPSRIKDSPQDPKDPIGAVLQSILANPRQSGAFQHGAEGIRPQIQAQADATPSAAIEVSQAGLTAISYETLASSGFPVDETDPQLLRISRAGVDIPTELEGNGDASFEPGERLLFYAAPRFSRWTASDVYFLQVGGAPGPAITSRPAPPGGLPPASPWIEVTAEENIAYTPECYCGPLPAGRDGDRWVWKDLRPQNGAPASFPIELSSVDSSQEALLTLWLIGYTDVAAAPDHRVDVKLNGASLGSVEWDGKQAVEESLAVPASVLQDGTNTLELALPGLSGVSVEGAWLDAFSIRYRHSGTASGENLIFEGEDTPHAYTLSLGTSELRAYDVTDPDNPLRLSDTAAGPGNSISLGDPEQGGLSRYWITTEPGILAPARVRMVSALQSGGIAGADYILITPAEFQPALVELIALRQSQGLTVAVEGVQAIYDAFGDGRPDPAAIRAFLAHAYTAWNPQPTYVLLVGDGTADPRRYSPASSATFIPPFLAEVDPWAGETAADNRYVTLEGDDNLPEMLIGRLPVNSLAEAQTVVFKIVGYEANPPEGSWNRTALLLADDADGGGNFPGTSEFLAGTAIPWPYTPLRLYHTPPEASAEDLRQGLLDAWNQGTGLVTFTGHSSIHQWAVERFFHLDDVANLSNGSRLPVVLELTCFTASFQVPGFPTLDEALLRHPKGGTAAVWGPTGLGIATGHETLAAGFLGALLEGNNGSLGAAALAGKIKLAEEHPAFLDLIDTYTLLGDPATQFNRASRHDTIFLPQVHKNQAP